MRSLLTIFAVASLLVACPRSRSGDSGTSSTSSASSAGSASTGSSGSSASSSGAGSTGSAGTSSASSSGAATGTSSSATSSAASSSGSTGSSGAASSGGSTGAVACSPTCNPGVGLCGPLQVCSTANPCRDLNGSQLTTPTEVPTCATDAGASRPLFADGPPLTWTDDNGDSRYACVHVPDAGGAPLPLLVFLHGSHGRADDLYNYTSLRSKADSYPLSGDGGPNGFAVASLQGRNLHWLGPNPDGSHFDWMYRDPASPTTNPDLRSLDHLVETLAASGGIDTSRIYVAGWSNGAFQAELYAVSRYDTATPGLAGPAVRVAAAVAYAGADPFSAPADGETACQTSPYPTTQAPVFAVHRSCDALVPCDQAQQAQLVGDGGAIPPGYAVEEWLSTLSGPMGDADVDDLIINYLGHPVSTCASSCGDAVGLLNHVHWPDGVADNGGVDHEPEMLDFLRNHPHP